MQDGGESDSDWSTASGPRRSSRKRKNEKDIAKPKSTPASAEKQIEILQSSAKRHLKTIYALESERGDLKRRIRTLENQVTALLASQKTTVQEVREEPAATTAMDTQSTTPETSVDNGSEVDTETEAPPKKKNRVSQPLPIPVLNKKSPQKALEATPIVLREKERWREVDRQLTAKNINIHKAKLIADGIQIFPTTIDDHKKIRKHFDDGKLEYHTHSLPEERLLRVVVRGLPNGIPCEDILEDFASQGFTVTSVQRMTNQRTKQPMPLVLVKTSLEQEAILQVTRCLSLVVRVERQRAAQRLSQCFRCQRFGHAQGKCTAQAKCVKCGLSHLSRDCEKTRQTPAKCANCQGAHPASYRGCLKFPKKSSPGQARKQQTAQTRPGRSFADAAKQTQQPPEAQNSAANLAEVTAQMQQLYAQMMAVFARMTQLQGK